MTVYHGSGSNVCLWDMFRFPDNCVWSLSNKVCNSNGPCWEHLSSNISLILVRFIGIIHTTAEPSSWSSSDFIELLSADQYLVHWSYTNSTALHSSVQSNVNWIKWFPFYLSFWQSFLEPVQQNGDMLSPGLSQVPIAVSGLYWIKYAIVMAPWQVAHPLCKCRWKGSGKNKQHQRYSQKILLSLSQKQTSKEKY